MSTAPFETAIASARSVLAAVRPDQLDDPTPCSSWKVRDLINHLIGAQHFFLAGMAGTPPAAAGDPAAGDYVASFDESAAQCLAAFQGDGVMERTFTLPFGQMPGAALLGLATTDAFVHRWDLAKATGQPTDVEPELAEELLVGARAFIQDTFRGPEGAPFGPEQQAPPDASKADQLVAFLGRTV